MFSDGFALRLSIQQRCECLAYVDITEEGMGIVSVRYAQNANIETLHKALLDYARTSCIQCTAPIQNMI